jgi:hypothetical protein
MEGHGSLDAEKTIPLRLAAVNCAARLHIAIASRGDSSDCALARGWFLAAEDTGREAGATRGRTNLNPSETLSLAVDSVW